MTTTTNLIELRKLAEAALVIPSNDADVFAFEDAAHPAKVIELLNTIEAQAFDLDIQAGSIEAVQAANNSLCAQIEAKAKQIAELEKTGNEWYEAHNKKRIQVDEQAKQIEALQAKLSAIEAQEHFDRAFPDAPITQQETLTERYLKSELAHEQSTQPVNELVEALCARIKAADDAAADNDYMLDSNDCISVIRGTWGGPMLNDKPNLAKAAQPLAKEKKEYTMGNWFNDLDNPHGNR